MTTEQLFTVHEVAKELRVTDGTVRRWIEREILDAIKLPIVHKRISGYRIKASTLDAILKSDPTDD